MGYAACGKARGETDTADIRPRLPEKTKETGHADIQI